MSKRSFFLAILLIVGVTQVIGENATSDAPNVIETVASDASDLIESATPDVPILVEAAAVAPDAISLDEAETSDVPVLIEAATPDVPDLFESATPIAPVLIEAAAPDATSLDEVVTSDVPVLIEAATEAPDLSENRTSRIEVRNDIKGRLLTPEQGCGLSNVPINNRIVGGGPARNGAWPWLALLGYKKGTFIDFSCGGSLITSRHVLSAAHCFKVETNFVRLGEYDTTTESDGKHIDIDIDHFDKHVLYTTLLKTDDIALLHLVHDVDFNDRIRPICLPTNEHMKNPKLIDQFPFVAGWGYLEEKSKMSNILHEVQIPIIGNEQCQEKYRKARGHKSGDDLRFKKSNVLCAGFTEGGKDTCQGDSGGPLMLPVHINGSFPFYQIGVISYGIGCGRANIPGIYTNVRSYTDWIIKKLK